MYVLKGGTTNVLAARMRDVFSTSGGGGVLRKGTWPHERSKETSRNAKKIFAKTPNIGAEATGEGRWLSPSAMPATQTAAATTASTAAAQCHQCHACGQVGCEQVVSNLCEDKLCQDKLCVDKLCEDKLCVGKLCVDKLCV